MPKGIRWTESAAKDLRRLDRPTAERVVAAVGRFAETGAGNVRRLRGYDAEWRLRVGKWRTRFTYDAANGQIVVLRVLPRSTAYRDE